MLNVRISLSRRVGMTSATLQPHAKAKSGNLAFLYKPEVQEKPSLCSEIAASSTPYSSRDDKQRVTTIQTSKQAPIYKPCLKGKNATNVIKTSLCSEIAALSTPYSSRDDKQRVTTIQTSKQAPFYKHCLQGKND